jgi:hypothetical protein
MVPFCFFAIRFVPTPTTIIWMIIVVTRFVTMSSVASSYLDTRYSGERREKEHLYQTMGYQTMGYQTMEGVRDVKQTNVEKKMTYVTVLN